MRRNDLTREDLLALRPQQLRRLSAIRDAREAQGDTARAASLTAILTADSQLNEQEGEEK